MLPGVEETIITTEPSRPAGSMGRFNRWDTPWINPKLIVGVTMIAMIVLLGLLGRVFWDENLAFVASGPLSQPPVGLTNLRGEVGTWAHPLGTENAAATCSP